MQNSVVTKFVFLALLTVSTLQYENEVRASVSYTFQPPDKNIEQVYDQAVHKFIFVETDFSNQPSRPFKAGLFARWPVGKNLFPELLLVCNENYFNNHAIVSPAYSALIILHKKNRHHASDDEPHSSRDNLTS